MNSKATNIFKKGSKTYYFSSIFFPTEMRDKVTTLYAYVRTVDDFVDSIPANKKLFLEYKNNTLVYKKGNEIIDNFLLLADTHNFKKEWIQSFLHSMELDLRKKTYETYEELESYMYGSANVIGYMMASTMGLPPKAFEAAGLQGKAMQLINFIRDIQEDFALGRTYIPQQDLKLFRLSAIVPRTQEDIHNFIRLIKYKIERYYNIQREAEKGYEYIPKRYLIPIKTAAYMYKWTAQKIYEDPMIVFRKKVKPSKARIVTTIIKHCITL